MIFVLELENLCLLPLIAVIFHGNALTALSVGGNYGHTRLCYGHTKYALLPQEEK